MNIKSILLGSLITVGSIFGAAANVEARPTGINKVTLSDGTVVYSKPVGIYGVEVLWDNKYSAEGFIANMDCSTGRYQWRANEGYTQEFIESILVTTCKM